MYNYIQQPKIPYFIKKTLLMKKATTITKKATRQFFKEINCNGTARTSVYNCNKDLSTCIIWLLYQA